MTQDELPALPEPWDFTYEWVTTPFGVRRSFSANHYNGSPCTNQVPIFTADQMRAYAAAAVLAEREACAKLAEDTEEAETEDEMGGGTIYGEKSAAAIRARSTQQRLRAREDERLRSQYATAAVLAERERAAEELSTLRAATASVQADQRAENDLLRAQLAASDKAAAWCDKHQPKGGVRGICVICAGYALSAALSKISYLCGEPNEMGVSIYDIDCDEHGVVERVEAMREQLAARDRDVEYLRWRLNEILPLFEEARDALPAISIAAAKLHRVDLSLGDRMDKAGTRTRAEFDAAIDAAMAPKP